jgi:hypothetical protein
MKTKEKNNFKLYKVVYSYSVVDKDGGSCGQTSCYVSAPNSKIANELGFKEQNKILPNNAKTSVKAKLVKLPKWVLLNDKGVLKF